MRVPFIEQAGTPVVRFPFLFGGTFIEGAYKWSSSNASMYFPSFSEGLSLRETFSGAISAACLIFPFLFGGTFIEGQCPRANLIGHILPFLFGGTFIEGSNWSAISKIPFIFPFLFGGTFIEGVEVV